MNPNARIGIEAELITNLGQSQLVDYLVAAGLNAVDADRMSNPTGLWGVKYDGSVHGGWEVVSPIMTPGDMYEMLPKLGQAFTAARSDGYRVTSDRSCGLHVHLSGIGETDVDKLRSICRGFMVFEEQFDLLQPTSRRGNANQYCRSNLARYNVPTYLPASYRWQDASLRAQLDHMWQSTGDCRSVDELYDSVCSGRYFKLNLEALDRHGSIEFRQHAGTANVLKMQRWAEFLVAFCDTRANALRSFNRTTRQETQGQRFRKLGRGVPADVMRYLRTRARQISGVDLMTQPARLAA